MGSESPCVQILTPPLGQIAHPPEASLSSSIKWGLIPQATLKGELSGEMHSRCHLAPNQCSMTVSDWTMVIITRLSQAQLSGGWRTKQLNELGTARWGVFLVVGPGVCLQLHRGSGSVPGVGPACWAPRLAVPGPDRFMGVLGSRSRGRRSRLVA